jgi:acetolactate synthase I/III small subunit
VVLEFTGHKEDTQALLEILKPFNLLEFSRSGRVAIAKPKFSVQEYLNNQT